MQPETRMISRRETRVDLEQVARIKPFTWRADMCVREAARDPVPSDTLV